jgi:hypothetical protein
MPSPSPLYSFEVSVAQLPRSRDVAEKRCAIRFVARDLACESLRAILFANVIPRAGPVDDDFVRQIGITLQAVSRFFHGRAPARVCCSTDVAESPDFAPSSDCSVDR